MDDDLRALRARLDEVEARAVYAGHVAEIALSMLRLCRPDLDFGTFLGMQAKAFAAQTAMFPGEEAMAARVAGLMADLAKRQKGPGPTRSTAPPAT